jgi:hypothetical protein
MATSVSINYGLYVYGNNAGLTTPTHARQAMAGMLYRPDALTARSGILFGGSNTSLFVAGTASMTVTVTSGSAVITRSAANGSYILTNPSTVTLDVATWAGARTDLIYIQHKDYALDGADGALIAIATGSTGTPTTAPSVPTGAIALATVYMPSTVTATNSGSVVITQLAPYVATAGGIVPVRNTTERDAQTWKIGDVIFNINDVLYYQYSGSAWSVFAPPVYVDAAFLSATTTVSTTNAYTATATTLPSVPYRTKVVITGSYKLDNNSGSFGASNTPSISCTNATTTSGLVQDSPTLYQSNEGVVKSLTMNGYAIIPANTTAVVSVTSGNIVSTGSTTYTYRLSLALTRVAY